MIACYLHYVYLTPCNDCIFQTHFLHATDVLYKCSVLQISFSSQLRMSDSCDFGKLLNTPCDKLLYARQTEKKRYRGACKRLAMYFAWESQIIEGKR